MLRLILVTKLQQVLESPFKFALRVVRNLNPTHLKGTFRTLASDVKYPQQLSGLRA